MAKTVKSSPGGKNPGDIVATNMNMKPSDTDPNGLDVNFSRVQTPFPPPAWLEAYNKLLPDEGPKLLLQYIAKEQEHRHDRERKEDEMSVMEINNNAREVRLGQWLGLASVGIVAVFLGYVAYAGYGTSAATAGTVIFVALAGIFLRKPTSQPSATHHSTNTDPPSKS